MCAPFACSAGQTDGDCSKMGFMMLPLWVDEPIDPVRGAGDDFVFLRRIREFVGSDKTGGYVILIGRVDQQGQAGNPTEASLMVKTAYGLGLTPILRLTGPNWER